MTEGWAVEWSVPGGAYGGGWLRFYETEREAVERQQDLEYGHGCPAEVSRWPST
jgi:hypothetical protein